MAAELYTERLWLRPWRASDRAPFAAMNADPEVMRYFPATLTRAESDAFVDQVEAELEQRGWGWWALEERSTQTFIGFSGLLLIKFEEHFTPAIEIGWRLARQAWGHGYATEAARAVAAFAFETLELDELVSFTTVANERSQAVMRRLGMIRDPAGDFDHPRLPAESPLRRHVLYRLRTPLVERS